MKAPSHATFVVCLAILFCAPGHAQVWQQQLGSKQVSIVTAPQAGVAPDPLAIQIAAPNTATTTVPIGIGQVVSVVPLGSQRLTLIKDNEVVIVDLDARQVADRFLAVRPTASPSGRWIAFSHLGGAATPEASVYLAVDVTAPLSQNRMGAVTTDPMTRALDAGIAVYPTYNRAAQVYTQPAGDVESDRHELRSPIVWCDDLRFAFLDYKAGDQTSAEKLTLVLVDLTQGTTNPSIREQDIPLGTIVDTAAFAQTYPGVLPSSVVMATKIQLLEVVGSNYRLELTFALNNEALKSVTLNVTI